MTDIWGGIGVDIGQGEGDWLYQLGAEVRGPMPKHAIAEKLVKGEISLDSKVAREGGEFHPIVRVAAFADAVRDAKKAQDSRVFKRRAIIGALIAVVVLAIGSVAGFYGYQRSLEARRQRAAEEERKRQDEEKRLAELDSVPKMGLVALVSLGTKDDVKIKSATSEEGSATKPKKPAGPPKGARAAAAAAKEAAAEKEEEQFVSSCKLTQADIFDTLRKNLGKINVCVEDEKARDKENLLPGTLEIEFVVQASGKVVDFQLNDRHYRTGPMNNCMIKAFRTIIFPESNGANCPVTLPIKIGK